MAGFCSGIEMRLKEQPNLVEKRRRDGTGVVELRHFHGLLHDAALRQAGKHTHAGLIQTAGEVGGVVSVGEEAEHPALFGTGRIDFGGEVVGVHLDGQAGEAIVLDVRVGGIRQVGGKRFRDGEDGVAGILASSERRAGTNCADATSVGWIEMQSPPREFENYRNRMAIVWMKLKNGAEPKRYEYPS